MRQKNAILITGGGQRIGLYLAQHFLSHTDYPVIISYRTYRPEIDRLIEMGAQAIQVDFCEPDAIETFIDQVTQRVESLRALIHNASVWMDDNQPDSLAQQLRLHVELPYQLNYGLIDLLRASDQPLKDIISISDARVSQGSGHQVGYLASKAAMQSMARSFAIAFAPQVKVNDIAPALIMFNSDDSPDYKQKRLAQSLLPIEPGAQVVWQAVEYLMQSRYSTGTVLSLDGGRHLM